MYGLILMESIYTRYGYVELATEPHDVICCRFASEVGYCHSFSESGNDDSNRGGHINVGQRYLDRRVGLLSVTLLLHAPFGKPFEWIGGIDVVMGTYVLGLVLNWNFWFATRNRGWLIPLGSPRSLCGLAAGKDSRVSRIPSGLDYLCGFAASKAGQG